MKKRVVCALMALSIAGTAGSGLAASNNIFSDVPAGSWAYDAVNQLYKAGIIDGENGRFVGDRTMTRYEMASVVAKAMSKRDKADANSKLALDKLAAEFASDLNKLGTRVSNLEKKADKVVLTGEARYRYTDDSLKNNTTGAKNGNHESILRTRIGFKGLLNNEWEYQFRIQNEQDLSTSGGENTILGNQAYVVGPVGKAKLAFGRMDYIPAYGLITDSTLDGAKLSFGNLVKINLYAGLDAKSGLVADGSAKYPVSSEQSYISGQSITAAGSSKTHVYGLDLSYALDDKTNVKGGYFQYSASGLTAGTSAKDAKMLEVGVERKLAEDWTVRGVYAKSSASQQNTAYLAGITYKDYDLKKVNSYNVYANYRHVGRLATWQSTYNMSNIIVNNDVHGAKGMELGVNYVPFKNSLFNLYYIDAKATDSTNWSDKQIRTQLYLYM